MQSTFIGNKVHTQVSTGDPILARLQAKEPEPSKTKNEPEPSKTEEQTSDQSDHLRH